MTISEFFKRSHSFASARKKPLDELPGTLSSDMRDAFEKGYQYGLEHWESFMTEYLKEKDCIEIVKTIFPAQTNYIRIILFAVFFHGISRALKEKMTGDATTRYYAAHAKIGALCLRHLTEFYRRLNANRSRHLFYTMYPRHKDSDPRDWEICCSGALGVALIIQAINRQGWFVYHPTLHEDVVCKIDLFAFDPSQEFGLCLQIKTKRNSVLALTVERPGLEQEQQEAFLLGMQKFTLSHPEMQWIPLFVTISLPNLAVDPQAIHPSIEQVISDTLRSYLLEEPYTDAS